MSPTRSTAVATLLALLAGRAPLCAAFESEAPGARLGLTVQTFVYEEFNDRDLSLDREEARLPGITGGLLYRPGRWLAGAEVRWHSGIADYTSPGIDSKTDEAILDLELLGGTRLFSGENQRLFLIAGIGYRRWHRDIRSTPAAMGQDERYCWSYGLLGLRGEHTFGRDTRLVGEFYGIRGIRPTLEARFPRGYDDAELDLGATQGLRLTLQRVLAPTITLWATPWYEHWEIGHSDVHTLYSQGAPVGTVFEPHSETDSYGLDLGVSWRFGGA